MKGVTAMLNKPVVAYNALSEVHCQDTIDFCLNHAEKQIGKIGSRRDSVSGKIDLNIRNVEVYAPPPDMGQYEMSRYGLHIENFFGPVFDANARFFNFEIDGPFRDPKRLSLSGCPTSLNFIFSLWIKSFIALFII